MADDNAVLKVGDTFAGSYRIVGEVGSGNNGVVYLARRELIDRDVALKVLRPELAKDRELIEALMNEARIAANLCHPNIVQALDAGQCNGIYYLAMEYVKGRTLEDIRINSPETISLEFLTEVSIQLAAALDYAWKNFSIVHGDIKPENLIIADGTHTLRLADLGLANISGRGGSADGSFMATPMYVAPELVSGAAASATMRSDIYSFGIMLYELVAGKPPFQGDTEEMLRAHVEEEPPPLIGENPDIPRALADFIHRMIRKSPEERPESWSEIGDFLRGFRAANFVDYRNGGTTVELAAEKTSASSGRPPRSFLWLGIIAGALFALFAAALVVLFVLSNKV